MVNGYGLSFRSDDVLKLVVGMVVQPCDTLKTIVLHTFLKIKKSGGGIDAMGEEGTKSLNKQERWDAVPGRRGWSLLRADIVPQKQEQRAGQPMAQMLSAEKHWPEASHCGNSLLIGSFFDVKWAARSSAESRDGGGAWGWRPKEG